MTKRFEFKAPVIRIVFYLITTNSLVAIVLTLSSAQLMAALLVMGFVNVAYLYTLIFKPFKIIIDQDKLLMEIHYFSIILKKHKIVPLREVECTFNYEVRARGGKARVLKIKYRNEPVVELLPEFNGWDSENLMKIFKKLNDLKKFY